jgi:predicted transcriptional regulator
MTDRQPDILVALTADIVSAHIAHNKVAIDALPDLITAIHAALAQPQDAVAAAPAVPAPPQPAVPIRQSVQRDHIVCLEDGVKLKMLKRYLRSQYGLSPDQYRARWKLPADYPMVAPDYSERRRVLARQIGLGTRSAER